MLHSYSLALVAWNKILKNDKLKMTGQEIRRVSFTTNPVISNRGEIIAMSALGIPYSCKKDKMEDKRESGYTSYRR